MKQQSDTRAVDAIVDLVTQTNFDTLPPEVVTSAKTFILDTIGVGISGSRVPFVEQLRKLTAYQWGGQEQATIWGSGERVPAVSAAMVNAYQIHNQEFDCLHEPAVVHAMATILATLLAHAERLQMEGRGVDGPRFICAVCIAVEVASILGAAATSALRFFRPGVCGGLGSAMGLAYLEGFNDKQIRDLLGVTYSQSGGTMQAHVEGSATLPMQIAFNARNAVTALDMVRLGLEGPHDVITGPFGLYTLFEPEADLNQWLPLMGVQWQITQLSQKPFPTGRAAHGGLDGIACLQAEHGFRANDVEHIHISAPPLILRLVDRPPSKNMHHNYAKLCMGYIAATYLLTGSMVVYDYAPECIADLQRQELAQKLSMSANDCDDPNALAPQTVTVTLKDGRQWQQRLPAVLGNPKRPLSRDQHLQKFRGCCRSGVRALADVDIEALIIAVDTLEQYSAIDKLVELMQFRGGPITNIKNIR